MFIAACSPEDVSNSGGASAIGGIAALNPTNELGSGGLVSLGGQAVEPDDIRDCRNAGLECGQGFICQQNSAGTYECLGAPTSAGEPSMATVMAGQPAPQPGPQAGQAAPSPVPTPAGQPAPMAGQPAPMAGQPASMAGQPAPMAGQPAPMAGQPAPMAGQPAPMAGQPAPTAGQPAPMAGQPAPIAGQPAPMAGPHHGRTTRTHGRTTSTHGRTTAPGGNVAPPQRCGPDHVSIDVRPASQAQQTQLATSLMGLTHVVKRFGAPKTNMFPTIDVRPANPVLIIRPVTLPTVLIPDAMPFDASRTNM